MQYQTYAQIKTKVLSDLGLEQEELVRTAEMMSYCNEAIDECESEIHTIYEDYFLTSASISLVQGQKLYSLPTNIYANKIRGIIYQHLEDIYPVVRIKELNKFEDIVRCYQKGTNDDYRYFLTNDSASVGVKLNLVPIARENITNALTVYYLRNANRITQDSDICDIPEFASFVIQWMKMRCYEKEGDPRFLSSQQLVEQQRKQMVETLNGMIPDGDNLLELDLEHYRDSV